MVLALCERALQQLLIAVLIFGAMCTTSLSAALTADRTIPDLIQEKVDVASPEPPPGDLDVLCSTWATHESSLKTVEDWERPDLE